MLVMVPDNPASGAIYIYDRVGQQFSLVSFEGADDTLTTQDFDGLLGEYGLLEYRRPIPHSFELRSGNLRWPEFGHFPTQFDRDSDLSLKHSSEVSHAESRFCHCGHGG